MDTDVINTSDSDSDTDVDALRNLAIISMTKPIKVKKFESLLCSKNQVNLESIDMELINNHESSPNLPDYPNELHSLQPRNRFSSSISPEEHRKSKLSVNSNIVNVPGPSSFFFDIDDIMNFDQNESAKNLIKEEELKNKLLKVLYNKSAINNEIGTDNAVHLTTYMDDSDDDHFDIFTHISPSKEIITDPNVLKYQNLISNAKNSITEIVNCISSLSNSIQDKLRKSKKMSIQIENLKNQKIELHKEISISRKKILDLNKIKKHKSVELLKYEQFKRKLANHSLSKLNEEILDSMSTTSAETNDSRLKSFEMDCNQIICPFWLSNRCVNKMCIYQHPQLFSKSTNNNKSIKIKENDKVFLKESNPMEFISKLHCKACSETVLVPTLHLKDDWHCKSCCQHLISLNKTPEILQQLILIWHHIYKRYQHTLNSVAVENRDPAILQNLSKCTQAIQAKLMFSENIPRKLFDIAARHIITTLHEELRINELIDFLLVHECNSNLVLFSSKLTMNPIKLYELLKASISYQISHSKFDDSFSKLINNFCVVSADVDLSLIAQLLEWLKLSIEHNLHNTHYSAIAIITRSLLSNCLGYGFMPPLTLAMRELELGDQFWRDNRPIILEVVQLYQSSSSDCEPGDLLYKSWMDIAIHRVIIRCLIISNFFTGDEELALRVCERYSTNDFSFYVLHSKLSLNYNSPIAMKHDKLRLTEHFYNKCQWLSINRSSESCVKLLEGLPRQLLPYNTIDNSCISCLEHYQVILGLQKFAFVQLPSDVLILRNFSSLWLCYIDLCVLMNQMYQTTAPLLYEVIRSLPLSSVMGIDHLTRVFASVISQLGTFKNADQYLTDVNRMLKLIDEKLISNQSTLISTIEYQYIIDIVNSIKFVSLDQYQLTAWLTIIDFCQKRLIDEDIDLLFVEVAVHLSSASLHNVSNNRICKNDDNCSVLRHIIACYPIKVPGPCIVLIDALIGLSTPWHLVIDVCENSLSKFPTSNLLWQRYYGCAMATGDVELLSRVRMGAERLGLNFDAG